MRNIVVYETATGRFKRRHLVDARLIPLNVNASESYIENIDDVNLEHHYMVGSVVTARPRMAIDFGQTTLLPDEEVTISGIPNGAIVEVKGKAYGAHEVTSGSIILSFPFGDWAVSITLFPYIQEVITYYARAAVIPAKARYNFFH